MVTDLNSSTMATRVVTPAHTHGDNGRKVSDDGTPDHSKHADINESHVQGSGRQSRIVENTMKQSTPLDNDAMGAFMSSMMTQKGVDMWSSLAERAGTLASINWLASHVPACVLAQINEETQLFDDQERNSENSSSCSSSIDYPSEFIDGGDEASVSDLSYSDHSEFTSVDASTFSDDSSISSDGSSFSGSEDLEYPEAIGMDFDAPEDESNSHSSSHKSPHKSSQKSDRSTTSYRTSNASSKASGKLSLSSISRKCEPPKASPSQEPITFYTKKWKSMLDFSLVSPAQVTCKQSSEYRRSARGLTSISAMGECDDSFRTTPILYDLGRVVTIQGQVAQFNDNQLLPRSQHELLNTERKVDLSGQCESLNIMEQERREPLNDQLKMNFVSAGDQSSQVRSLQSRKSCRSSESVNFFPGQLELPFGSRHVSALLFIDISGFTKLSTILDPESLSKAINAYFHNIVDLVISHGGDVLKFAGDAVFAEWKTTTSTPQGAKELKLTIDLCVCAAATCAAAIVAQCSDFPVSSDGSDNVKQAATLNVHCGLGVGEIVGLHLGDHEHRREYIILGDPIDQVAEAEGAAELGEVAASPKFLAILAKTCSMEGKLASLATFKEPVVIAQREVAHFAVDSSHRQSIQSCFDRRANREVSRYTEGWKGVVLEKYRKLLSLYAHPVVVANDLAALQNPVLKCTVEERQREEAELRNVYVMFINPLISVTVTGERAVDQATFKRLNNILNITTRELNRFSGHLRQFIVDDKGVVLIATFGLRGSTFPSMVPEHALPATISIHRALQSELGVESRIGATVGTTYCGVVGGVMRHEYAVLGPSVNLAARLMACKGNRGILVDENVRSLASDKFGFEALSPVVAKGYIDPVPIYEPLNPSERGWSRPKINFVGRCEEMAKLIDVARTMALAPSPTRMVVFTGESGMGKSTLLVHSVGKIKSIMQSSRRHLIVTKYVSKDCDQLIPFSMFASLLIDVLGYFERWSEDKSISSQGCMPFLNDRSSKNLSYSQMNESFNSSKEVFPLIETHHIVANRLRAVCHDMDAPPEFAEIMGEHIVVPGQFVNSQVNKKSGTKSSLVSFMAEAFIRCTNTADLVLIALDDVHNTDELSWKVLQVLFATGTNILIFCASRRIPVHNLTMSDDFWRKLNDQYRQTERFVTFILEPLSREEVLRMIAITINLREVDVAPELLQDVYSQSAGMPQFVNELLEILKKRQALDKNNEVGQNRRGRRMSMDNVCKMTVYTSFDQLILHRIDSLDAGVRNILNLGAVLGSTFELIEVVEVFRQLHVESSATAQVKQTKEALRVAVKEGILDIFYFAGENRQSRLPRTPSQSAFDSGCNELPSRDLDPVECITYSFCHDIWRSTILKLMLSSRRRDVHRIIAETLEYRQHENTKNYFSKMKLFRHWRDSGVFEKTAELALSIGTRFEDLGLNTHRIRLAEEAMAMLGASDNPKKEANRVLPPQVLRSATVNEVQYMIKLEISMGKAHANIHNAAESVMAYQSALKILQEALVADEMEDRSIVFPIFSGLFIALKLGMIKQDADCLFEKNLVARFVRETKTHGDSVHYLRALAMEAETFGRLGEFDRAFQTKKEIQLMYNPEEHSQAISQIYGSDRAAQAIGLSSVWYYQTGDITDALRNCDLVINHLLPKMDLRNVHNSFVLILPSLWVMKESDLAHESGFNFSKYVVEPFHLNYPEGAFTYFLPLYRPIMILFDLACYSKNEGERPIDFNVYLEWALNNENLRPPEIMNSMGNLGRLPGSISGEICLLLAEKLENGFDRTTLVRNGLAVASEALTHAVEKGMTVAETFARPIFFKLTEMAALCHNEKISLSC